MIIILVHWQIRPESEERFLAYRQEKATVRDRTGLICEFLSRVEPHEPVQTPWITWRLPPQEDDEATHYVNVGLWSGAQAFLEQIASDFGDDSPIRSFELRRRRRLLLTPQTWRIGAADTPRHDSPGVI